MTKTSKYFGAVIFSAALLVTGCADPKVNFMEGCEKIAASSNLPSAIAGEKVCTCAYTNLETVLNDSEFEKISNIMKDVKDEYEFENEVEKQFSPEQFEKIGKSFTSCSSRSD